MTLPTSTDDLDIAQLFGTSLRDCYQCGKCSAGCPMADAMDVLPNRLIRLVQLGQVEKAMRAESIWKCVSCMTCTARCPKSVDCAGVMDALRQMAFERGVVPKARQRTVLFQKAFLDNIRRNGRLRELELVGAFKTAGVFPRSQPAGLDERLVPGPQAHAARQAALRRPAREDRAVVGRIFARCMPNALIRPQSIPY